MAVIPGDGIGVDVIAEAVRVLETVAASSGRTVRLTSFDWGAEHFLATGVTLPEGALDEMPGTTTRSCSARSATRASPT